MTVTLDFSFIELYIHLGATIGAFIFASYVIIFFIGVYKWYDQYIIGTDRNPRIVDIVRVYGINFKFWADDDCDYIGPGTIIAMFFAYTIGGVIMGIVFGFTWIVSIPVYIFNQRSVAIHNKNKEAKCIS